MTARIDQTAVCIVGVGACTALGADLPSSAAAVRATLSAFGDHPYMIDKDGEPMVVALASSLPEDLGATDRLVALAIAAAQEALASLTADRMQVQGMPAVIGLPPRRPGRADDLDDSLAQRCKTDLGGGAQLAVVRTVASGHAAGLEALEQAWRLIRSGELEACLVGGVDSYLEPETLEWLDDLEQLHSNTNKWGFIPGEGAGFVLLSSPAFAQKHSLSPLGEVLAVALAQEKNLIKTDSVCIGEGLSAALTQVLQRLPSPEETIHQTICDLNGERYPADEFGYSLVRTAGRYSDPGEFLAPADCWGDVGAASAALFIGLAVTAGQKGYADGPNTLVWAGSESGERGAAVVRVEPTPREV